MQHSYLVQRLEKHGFTVEDNPNENTNHWAHDGKGHELHWYNQRDGLAQGIAHGKPSWLNPTFSREDGSVYPHEESYIRSVDRQLADWGCIRGRDVER